MSTITSLALTVILAKQDPTMLQPPAELKHFEFMLGEWKSTGMATLPNGQSIETMGTFKCTKILDRWFQLETSDTMKDLGTMNGRFMVTYDPDKKKWEGIWFDSMTGHSMKTVGEHKDKSFVFLSEEIKGPDGNPTQYSIKYSNPSPNQVTMKVEMKMGDKFMPALTHNYKK